MKNEFGLLVVALAVSAFVVWPWEIAESVHDARLRPHAVVIGGLWTVARLVAFWRAWRRWRAWRLPAGWSIEAKDLPFESTRRWLPRLLAKDCYSFLGSRAARWLYPDKGILLGRAFRWSPAHTQELETYLQGGRSLPVGKDTRGGYPALHAVGKKEERPLVLPWSELVGHVLIGGTTRSGKTRLLEVILSEAIRGPGTVIVIDPKGDAELLVRAAAEAHRGDRRFAFFSPAHADQSVSFNPFGMCDNTTELAARVQALMPGGGGMARGDPFFTEYPLAVVERLGAAQKAVGDQWTIEGLHAVTTMVPPFDDLVARYLYQVLGGKDSWAPALDELLAEYARKRGDRQDPLADALIDDKEKPRDHFVQVTANLVPAFRGVTGGKMDRLLSSPRPQLTWKDVVEERKVVYFAMSSLLYGEVANRIGRVILQDLIGFLGRRYARDDPAKMTPLTILIDEFSNVAYPGFIDALNKGGGARANIMLAMQSLADPEAAMGKDGTQRVLDNLNTRVWFRLTDDATAKLAVEGLGMTSVGREDISHSLSFGGGSATSGGSRGGMQYVDRSLVRSEWVTGLPRGEAFVRTRGENWKLRVPLLRAVGKEEVRRMAEAFGLESVIAELKDTAEAGESGAGTGTANDRLRESGANGAPADNGKGSARQANKQPAGAGKASRAAASADGAARLGDAFGGGDSADAEAPSHENTGQDDGAADEGPESGAVDGGVATGVHGGMTDAVRGGMTEAAPGGMATAVREGMTERAPEGMAEAVREGMAAAADMGDARSNGEGET